MAAKNRLTSKTVALPLWERVGVRGSGPSIERTPLTRIASQFDLSHKGRGKVRYRSTPPVFLFTSVTIFAATASIS